MHRSKVDRGEVLAVEEELKPAGRPQAFGTGAGRRAFANWILTDCDMPASEDVEEGFLCGTASFSPFYPIPCPETAASVQPHGQEQGREAGRIAAVCKYARCSTSGINLLPARLLANPPSGPTAM